MEKVKATTLLVAVLAISSLASWVLYTDDQVLRSNISDQQSQVDTLKNSIQIYSRLFDSNLKPPISKVEAVQKALSSDGWNSSSLSGMQVQVYLIYIQLWRDNSGNQHGFEYLGNVTHPLRDYSPRTEYNTTSPWSTARVLETITYRYVWIFSINESSIMGASPSTASYIIDASTGELFKWNGLGAYESIPQ